MEIHISCTWFMTTAAYAISCLASMTCKKQVHITDITDKWSATF